MLVEKLLSILKLYVVFNPPVEMASMVTPIEEQHVLSSFGDICFALGGFGYRHSAARVTQKPKTKPRHNALQSLCIAQCIICWVFVASPSSRPPALFLVVLKE